MDGQSFTIRTMTIEDLALVLDWAAAEGWNPGLDDAACFNTGYGIARPCREGWKIGPLLADDAAVAE